MTGTTESRRLQYDEEGDISMISIATSNRKIIPDTKAKPPSAHITFHLMAQVLHISSFRAEYHTFHRSVHLLK